MCPHQDRRRGRGRIKDIQKERCCVVVSNTRHCHVPCRQVWIQAGSERHAAKNGERQRRRGGNVPEKRTNVLDAASYRRQAYRKKARNDPCQMVTSTPLLHQAVPRAALPLTAARQVVSFPVASPSQCCLGDIGLMVASNLPGSQ